MPFRWKSGCFDECVTQKNETGKVKSGYEEKEKE